MAINANSWKRMPIADRDQAFNADEAFKRIQEWARGSSEKFASMYLWNNPQGSAGAKDTYRLPVGDIIDGRPHVVPHAVFTAAAILSGAHGGLVGVIDENENLKLKGVVTDIYTVLADMYNDPRVKPPWLRGGNKEEDVTAAMTASVNSSGWSSMPVADTSRPWDGAAAKQRLWNNADGDVREYRRGFLWWDQNAPENKGSYKLPIADVVDGKLTIVPRAVNAVAAVLNGARGGVDIPDSDMDAVQSLVNRIQRRFQPDDADAEQEAATAAAAPVAPPASWFTDPQFQAATPITVTADGRVMGHLAAWGVCHASFSNKCVMAPHSAVNYKYFLNGAVLTADGAMVRIGKITLGTGHADIRLGWIPAADHYDNTGTAAAVVAAGEDQYGIWVAGAMVPEASEETMAQLRRSPLSGDWRRINGNLELVAALAVNTPGFPIVSMNASGEPDGLCAAGVVLEDGTVMASEEPQDPPRSQPDERMLARLDSITAYVDKLAKDRRGRRYQEVSNGMQ